MRTIKLFLFLLLTGPQFIYAQVNLLQSGPMVGYSTMREVKLWVQTKEAAQVCFAYWLIGQSEKKHYTDCVRSNKNDAYTVQAVADELEPGNFYEYELIINDRVVEIPYKLRFKTQELWQWRSDPPKIKFAFGSCLYINEDVYDRPGKPYGGDYNILTFLYEKEPEFMIWMGDNTYLREADWSARSSILKRYTHTRSLPQLQPLLGSVHHYATWDDHDYGPDNSDRSFWNKEITYDAFRLFWANPSYGIGTTKCVTTFFQWGDLDFYLMDDRWFRTPENRKYSDREILGDVQIEWLIDALSSSRAPFKFVVIGTQFLNPNAQGENFSSFPEEKNRILELIEKEKIEGVIFLTGDVHRAEVSKLNRKDNYPLYDLTISPFTAGPNTKTYPNELRLDGSLLADRNFGIISVEGPRKNRQLNFNIFDKDGKLFYELSINENELK